MPLSKASLERLIEASPDMVVATDPNGDVAYYNDGAEENLGYARDEIIGCHVTELYPSLEEAKRVKAAMRDPKMFSRGRILNFPTRFVAKDGHEIPVAISGLILYDDAGEEQGTIGFAKDLTEILRRDQLAILGEIAVGLSHEINNPLEVITNQLALLQSFVASQGSAEERETESDRIASMRREVERISRLLSRLGEMAEREQYESTPYLGNTRMIKLSGASRARESPLRGARVLVVDDDPGVRESVVDILRADGAEVEQASNGVEALQTLGEAHFDLLLTDVVMPDMDGYDLFEAAKQRYPKTAIALMTAFYYDREHVIKRSRMEGLEGVIFKKPVDPDLLRETLGKLLRPPRPAPSSR